MDRYEFTDSLGGSAAGIGGRLDRSYVSAHEDGHQTTANELTADKSDFGRLLQGGGY